MSEEKRCTKEFRSENRSFEEEIFMDNDYFVDEFVEEEEFGEECPRSIEEFGEECPRSIEEFGLQNNNGDFGNRRRRCRRCVPLKENCQDSCCDGLKSEHCDVSCAVCTPILTERIFDCISLEQDQSGYLEDVEFKIEGDTRRFVPGSSICIDRIGVTYSFIGLEDDDVCVTIDAKPFTFVAPIGSEFLGCTREMKKCEDDKEMGRLFDEFEGTVVTNKYCCENPPKAGTKVRIVNKDLNFKVCNLKFIVEGRIGCRPFRAIARFNKNGNVPVEVLGFNDVTLVGRMCLPTAPTKVTVHEEIDTCLSVNCITTNRTFRGGDCFKAAVETSLLVKMNIFATMKEKISVFSKACQTGCRNGSLPSSCPRSDD